MDNQDLGAMADELHSLRERRRKIEAKFKPQVDEVNQEYALLEEQLKSAMDEAGTRAVRGSMASYTLTPSITWTVKKWDAFSRWCIQHDLMHCIQARITPKAVTEASNTSIDRNGNVRGRRVPGLERTLTYKGTLANVKS